MDERELERLLAEAGAEESHPSPDLLRRTCRRLYDAPLLRASVCASLIIQTLGGLAVILALLSPELSLQTKLVLSFCCLAVWGGALIVLVAARHVLGSFLGRLEISLADGSRCP